MEVGVVGKKYDLYPPKGVREELGLKPGQKVVYKVEGKRMVIEVIPDVVEAEKLPKFAETTVEEFERFTKELQEESLRKLGVALRKKRG